MRWRPPTARDMIMIMIFRDIITEYHDIYHEYHYHYHDILINKLGGRSSSAVASRGIAMDAMVEEIDDGIFGYCGSPVNYGERLS